MIKIFILAAHLIGANASQANLQFEFIAVDQSSHVVAALGAHSTQELLADGSTVNVASVPLTYATRNFSLSQANALVSAAKAEFPAYCPLHCSIDFAF